MRLELTRRADYAIRAMLAVNSAEDRARPNVRNIAADQRIPPEILPRIMSDLVRAGLVASTAGRSGGYRLARPGSAISLLDVIEAIEGDGRRRSCILRQGPCSLDGVCDVHLLFAQAQEAMLGMLSTAKLDEVTRQAGEAAAS
ncbi:MAG: Rrf2 family transcriptional regulator [Chloroflexota bacterium]